MTSSGPPVGPEVADGAVASSPAVVPAASTSTPDEVPGTGSPPPGPPRPPAPPPVPPPAPPTASGPSAPPALPGRRRRSRIPLISAITVGCLTALLVAVLATSKDASNTTVAPSPLQNKPAPEIRGPTLGGGNGSLTAFKGKWVLINFFASWCVPCQQEQPDLVKFQNEHAAGDAVIFGVRFDDPDVGPIQDLMNKSGAKWPIVDDPNAKIMYSVTGPPESFLVSPAGVVLVHVIGPITDARLEDLLNQAKLVVTTPTQVPSLVGPGGSTP